MVSAIFIAKTKQFWKWKKKSHSQTYIKANVWSFCLPKSWLTTNAFLGTHLWKKTISVSKYWYITLQFTKHLRALVLLALVTNLCPEDYWHLRFINRETESAVKRQTVESSQSQCQPLRSFQWARLLWEEARAEIPSLCDSRCPLLPKWESNSPALISVAQIPDLPSQCV